MYSDALAGVQTESPEARVQLLDVKKRWEQRQRAVTEDSRRPDASLCTPRGGMETIRLNRGEVETVRRGEVDTRAVGRIGTRRREDKNAPPGGQERAVSRMGTRRR